MQSTRLEQEVEKLNKAARAFIEPAGRFQASIGWTMVRETETYAWERLGLTNWHENWK
jgi:hypothetical protein